MQLNWATTSLDNGLFCYEMPQQSFPQVVLQYSEVLVQYNAFTCAYEFLNLRAYELLNLRALKISMLYKNHIFQCTGKIFCVEFQRVPLKFHTKYLTHALKDVDFIHRLKFKSSEIEELMSVVEMLIQHWVQVEDEQGGLVTHSCSKLNIQPTCPIRVWMNHITDKLLDEITYPCPNLK